YQFHHEAALRLHNYVFLPALARSIFMQIARRALNKPALSRNPRWKTFLIFDLFFFRIRNRNFV
ncbi:MAG TPA: hypothetical protein DIT66_05935, partial [Rhodobiaceae bacterium]|nr:hypothetical protein [Rhodobiaceae bacterium]